METTRLLIGFDGSGGAQNVFGDLPLAGLPEVVQATVLDVADIFLWENPPYQPREDERYDRAIADIATRIEHRHRNILAQSNDIARSGAERIEALFPKWQITYRGCPGSPAWEIVQQAADLGADLIVLGSRHHSALHRGLFGSVAHTVAAQSPCSVRICRWPEIPSVSSPRVVVGVDGSPSATLVVERVAARAWPTGTEMLVVAVKDLSLMTFYSQVPLISSEVGALIAEEEEYTRYIAEKAADRLRGAGLSVAVSTPSGHPKTVLVAEADRFQATSLFVGARGLRGLERLLLGGVSAAVAARSHCSVEIVRK